MEFSPSSGKSKAQHIVKKVFSYFLKLHYSYRGTEFKEDDAIWKNGEDGGAGGGGPPPQGMGAMGPTGGYVAK